MNCAIHLILVSFSECKLYVFFDYFMTSYWFVRLPDRRMFAFLDMRRACFVISGRDEYWKQHTDLAIRTSQLFDGNISHKCFQGYGSMILLLDCMHFIYSFYIGIDRRMFAFLDMRRACFVISERD